MLVVVAVIPQVVLLHQAVLEVVQLALLATPVLNLLLPLLTLVEVVGVLVVQTAVQALMV
jgi:hypothetical protein